MNPKEILTTAKEIISELENDTTTDIETKKRDLMVKYESFSLTYPVIFLSAINGTLELAQFEKMIDMATRVKSNNISSHDASVKIGTELVNEYVKPIVKKNKK